MSILLFSYGSNSIAQLRARCQNPSLVSHRALVDGYARIFAGSSKSWEGAVASMAEVSGAKTYGSLVQLTVGELELLEQYEGGYTQRTVMVNDLEKGTQVEAVTFIKNDVSFQVPPSQAYLTAIHMHLRENFPGDPCTITMRRASAGGGVKLIQAEEWCLPAIEECDMLSFLVRVNNHPAKSEKWAAPKELHRVKDKLAKCCGFKSVGVLRGFMNISSDAALNHALLQRGEKAFSSNTCHVMRKLLGLAPP